MDCDELRNISFPGVATTIPGVRNEFYYAWAVSLFVIYSLLIFCFFAFKFLLPQRKQFDRLHDRPFIFVLLTHFGGLFSFIPGSWHEAYHRESCWFYFFSFFLTVPLAAIPMFARLLNLYRSTYLTKLTLATREQFNDTTLSSEEKGSEIGSVQFDWKSYIKSSLLCCVNRQRSNNNLSQVLNSSKSHPAPGPMEIRVQRFWRSNVGTILTMSFFLFPYCLTVIILLTSNEMVLNNCVNCETPDYYTIVLTVESAFALVLVILGYRMNLRAKDPYGIVQEMRLCIWVTGVPIVICLILISVGESRNGSVTLIVEGLLAVYCFFQSGLQCILAVIDQSRKSKVRSRIRVMGIQEFENDVIQKGSKYHVAFQDYLIAENGVESLTFLLGIFDWERSYFDAGARTSRALARKLIRTYVGDGALIPCNLPSTIVRDLQKQLQFELAAEISLEVFQKAKEELISLLYYDAYRRFILTDSYTERTDSSTGAQ